MRPRSDQAIDRLRHRNRWLTERCLDRAERRLATGRHAAATCWLRLAVRLAATLGAGYLAHPRLERVALALARTLPPSPSRAPADSPRRWLHVLTGAYEIGGHTTFLRRWIENDPFKHTHSVVLTGGAPVPAAFRAIVERRGGTITVLPVTTTLARAEALRAVSGDADVVVLHHGATDIVPALAFGVPGGPPVLTVNHADHIFWPGATVTDLSLNHRPVSADLNRRYRSIDRNVDLPIRLDFPPGPAQRASDRLRLRQSLGIPAEAIVFVTVARESKYIPIGDLDFPAAAAALLSRLPDAWLIAVGPRANRPEWHQHIRAARPRLIAVGPQSDVNAYLAAGDIYLEGFPFDSATALLEAALAGLPVVPVPAVAPLPFSAHGGLKAAIPQPASVSAYLDDAAQLAGSPALRHDRAEALTAAVVRSCTGDGWSANLDRIVRSLPPEHRTYPVADVPLDEPLDRFLTRLLIGTQRLPRVIAGLLHEAIIAR